MRVEWVAVALAAILLMTGSVAGYVLLRAGMPTRPDLSSVPDRQLEKAKIDLEYDGMRQRAIETLVVGVMIGLASLLVPTVAAWNRERFERYKESRQAYSAAHTGIMYLPKRLAGLKYNEAMELLYEIHEKKHLAEAYPELVEQVTRGARYASSEDWSKEAYEKLAALERAIADRESWDKTGSRERLAKLNKAVARVPSRRRAPSGSATAPL